MIPTFHSRSKASVRRVSLHYGPVGRLPGGIAQVVNVYASAGIPGWDVRMVCTVSAPGDPWSPLRATLGFGKLIRWRFSRKSVLVVVHLSQRGSFVREGAILLLARLLRLRRAAFIHGSSFVAFAADHPTLCRAVLRSANDIFVLTQQTSAAVQALRPEMAPTLLRNLVQVPTTVSHQSDRDQEVLFAGEVSARKGADTLLEAWESIDTRGWRLSVAGPVSDPRFRTVRQGIDILGPLSHEDIVAKQAKVAIAILPSRAEALPMFLIESLAAGCAVIGSDVGQIPSLLEQGAAGVVVDPDSPENVAEALTSLMASLERRIELATQGRRVADAYSIATSSAEIAEHWDRVFNPDTLPPAHEVGQCKRTSI